MHYYYYNFSDLIGVMGTLGPAFILWFIILPGVLLALLILMFLRLLKNNSHRDEQRLSGSRAGSRASFYRMEKNKHLIDEIDQLMTDLEARVQKLEQKQTAHPDTGEQQAGRAHKEQE